MDRNEAVFFEQYGAFEAQRKAEEEARVAAAAARSPAFTYSELGLDDPGDVCSAIALCTQGIARQDMDISRSLLLNDPALKP
ncbi:hypothetical protein A2U01_0016447 [Trifolium medium]|uniref:Uncharacterized protein n=1 Tax=Trifolium medium TaxID=97028 RepID=A0A392N6P3_9FABA|nr:hypothetical protein [Trifolium medium]